MKTSTNKKLLITIFEIILPLLFVVLILPYISFVFSELLQPNDFVDDIWGDASDYFLIFCTFLGVLPFVLAELTLLFGWVTLFEFSPRGISKYFVSIATAISSLIFLIFAWKTIMYVNYIAYVIEKIIEKETLFFIWIGALISLLLYFIGMRLHLRRVGKIERIASNEATPD